MEWLLILSLCLVGFFVCGCPCTCTNCFDQFTRANNTDINVDSPCGWTEVAGSWDIIEIADPQGNVDKTLATSSSNAIAIMTTTATSVSMGITANCHVTANGDILWAIVDYQDSSNFHFAELKLHPTTGYLKIRKRTGGVDADLATSNVNCKTGNGAPTRAAFHVCISQTGDYISARFQQTSDPFGSGIDDGVSATITPYGFGVGGVGTGTLTGTGRFNSVRLYETRASCQQCTALVCSNCDTVDEFGTQLTPQEFKVVIAGLVNGTCLLCAGHNGTFYYDRGGLTYATDCIYTAPAGNPCAFGTMELEILANNVIHVRNPGSTQISWKDTASSGFVDCDELVDRSIPFESSGGKCAGAASTCLVTSS